MFTFFLLATYLELKMEMVLVDYYTILLLLAVEWRGVLMEVLFLR